MESRRSEACHSQGCTLRIATWRFALRFSEGRVSMKSYLECWITSAKNLFSQALAGEPRLVEIELEASDLAGVAYRIDLSGSLSGQFTVILDPEIASTPLLGEGVDQVTAWTECLREVAEAAAGELLNATGQSCRVEGCRRAAPGKEITRAF